VELIPLSFHVDYWNHIGWKDEFSSPRWSARQKEYAARISKRTYTPQLVVQGSLDCVGSDERCVRGAIERARAEASLGTVELGGVREVGGSVLVEAVVRLKSAAPNVIASVIVYESGLSTEVRRGENRGRRLQNDFVVRTLQEVGTIEHGELQGRRVTAKIPMRDEWESRNLGAVVLLQDPSSRRIIAAARSELERGEARLTPLPKAKRVPAEDVALGGHCPVALVEGKRLMRGSPELQYRYQGVVYQLASAAAASKFAREPALYVPPFSVFDPVAFSETRERTTGSLSVFTLHQGKPWFFLNVENRNKFLSQPEPYVQTALASGN
jgi:YHS domain-containing protein